MKILITFLLLIAVASSIIVAPVKGRSGSLTHLNKKAHQVKNYENQLHALQDKFEQAERQHKSEIAELTKQIKQLKAALGSDKDFSTKIVLPGEVGDDVGDDYLIFNPSKQESSTQNRRSGSATSPNLIGASSDEGSGLEDDIVTVSTTMETPSSTTTTPNYVEYAIVGVEIFNESSLPGSEVDQNGTSASDNNGNKTSIDCNGDGAAATLKATIRALKHQLQNLTTVLDAEQMNRRNEQDFVTIQARRHMNAMVMTDKAIKFTATLNRLMALPPTNDLTWIHKKLSNIELHNVVQIPRPIVPGMKRPLPPIQKFVFSVYGENLTASDAAHLCKHFGGASLANIRSKFESDMLELSYEALEAGMWLGLVRGPTVVANASVTAFWWSDGYPLIASEIEARWPNLTEKEINSLSSYYGELIRFRDDDAFDNASLAAISAKDSTGFDTKNVKNCARIAGGINTHLETEECDAHLPAALCELPSIRPWFTIIGNREIPGLNWTLAIGACSTKNFLVDPNFISFQDDDIHLRTLLEPVMTYLAVPKLPSLLMQVINVLSAYGRIDEPCWIGLRQERRQFARYPDMLRWLDGSLVVNAPGDLLYQWSTTLNPPFVEKPAKLEDEMPVVEKCVAVSATPSLTLPGKFSAKFSLVPCEETIQCALCQTLLPTA